ncbi:amidohydrolase [Sporomusa acidovorans]|uniref:5-methylthioadenosine/S-adenosylhomocysteine deaminase n=1 Tax=Sporomusa acidovorans (strain ATCC 49682 / DSM 3132 / Mol) TaxID=1123286 RepID=A0ABZ3J418_SPOA4|nr:amidohydrolase [Sporomusa acidovorans]OZC20184.1 5-methylthioadenosine/S-adenosylhomocysteine deaminase [Sporomusa acidovorans DSM 3132]SDD42653.1 5-methylthioadenosine/S-adenosylhomocysteine deaminase [Sporomusa acidovorans]
MNNILLKDGDVLCADGQVRQQDIAISGSFITQIGTVEGQADRIIDCHDKLIIPGFVNTHTHAAMTLFRSYADDMMLMDWLQTKIWPAEENLTAEDVYWGTLLAIAEMLKSGTTCFADMYFFMPEVARAVAESGIRAVLARGMAGVAPTANQALAESENFYKEWHNTADGRITVMLGPHAPYTCPPDYLKKVTALAAKLGAQIHIHLSETAGEVADCQKQYGKSPIALMEELGVLDHGVLAAHCIHISPNDIAIMKEKGVRVAHNPGSNMKLASGVAPVPDMQKAGLCVGLGTDGAASNNNLDMLEELRLAAMLHKVHRLDPLSVPTKTAVDMATVSGAEAVGLGTLTGKIQTSYKADITIFDMQEPYWHPRHERLSLLTYAASSRDVHTVIVDGKILLDNHQLTTIDQERLIAEVDHRGIRLVNHKS